MNKSHLTLRALSAILCVQASPAEEKCTRLLSQVEPRIRAIYESHEFTVRSFGATWLPDGSGYYREQ